MRTDHFGVPKDQFLELFLAIIAQIFINRHIYSLMDAVFPPGVLVVFGLSEC